MQLFVAFFIFNARLDWSVEFEVWSSLIPLPPSGGGKHGDKHYYFVCSTKNTKPSMITEDFNHNPLTQLINKFIHSVNHRSVLGKKKI